MTNRYRNCSYGCPVEATIDVIGGKWKSVILFHLLERTHRFNELRRLLPDVTQRMLTLQLRELERDGLISRTVYAEVPPKVEYNLTPFGDSLRPIILLMRDWGAEYMDAIRRQRLEAAALPPEA
jgi:DNA-binding HxlR family transcriptional regulator